MIPKDKLDNVIDLKGANPVAAYLMAGFLYESGIAESPLTDYTFDTLAFWLFKNYDKLTHNHKHLIPYEAMKEGTFSFSAADWMNFPQLLKDAAVAWSHKNNCVIDWDLARLHSIKKQYFI